VSRTIVITGSESGMGQATSDRLKAKGHRIIGVDLRGAAINVDLGTVQGRDDMAAQVRALAPDGIDGVLTSAGVADFERPGLVVSVNYFGTIATLQGLHPMLRGPGARCVAVASTAILISSPEILELERLCLAGDEDGAVIFANRHSMLQAYPASKRALTHWARQASSVPEWAGSGKLLNVVAPGTVKTPMIAKALDDPAQSEAIRNGSPIAVDDFAEADSLAEVMEFLLTFEGNYIVGQVVFADGGTEVITRPTDF
jgi:NAD(P)-dependent dehydrogenase (short-subunit alcohol dehydrogenase family)